jgi:hypothetical protein
MASHTSKYNAKIKEVDDTGEGQLMPTQCIAITYGLEREYFRLIMNEEGEVYELYSRDEVVAGDHITRKMAANAASPMLFIRAMAPLFKKGYKVEPVDLMETGVFDELKYENASGGQGTPYSESLGMTLLQLLKKRTLTPGHQAWEQDMGDNSSELSRMEEAMVEEGQDRPKSFYLHLKDGTQWGDEQLKGFLLSLGTVDMGKYPMVVTTIGCPQKVAVTYTGYEGTLDEMKNKMYDGGDGAVETVMVLSKPLQEMGKGKMGQPAGRPPTGTARETEMTIRVKLS